MKTKILLLTLLLISCTTQDIKESAPKENKKFQLDPHKAYEDALKALEDTQNFCKSFNPQDAEDIRIKEFFIQTFSLSLKSMDSDIEKNPHMLDVAEFQKLYCKLKRTLEELKNLK